METWTSALLSPSVSLIRGEYGFELKARESIDVGSALVRVPSAVAITAEGALRSPTVASLVNRQTEAHVTMAAWLLDARRTNGTHGDYARALNDADIDCTLLWSTEELGMLQTSRAANKAWALRGWALAEYGQMGAPHFSEAEFLWSLCAIWSRSFQMQCAEPDCGGAAGTSGGVWRVLAPGADLLNHDPHNPAAELQVRADGARPEMWQQTAVAADGSTASSTDGDSAVAAALAQVAASWSAAADSDEEESRDALVLRAKRKLNPGDDVTLDYGPRANAELLTTHGFALPSNAAESCPIDLGIVDNDPLAPIKRKLLEAGNISAPYDLSPSALTSDSSLLVALRIIAANAHELKGQAYAPAFEGKPLSARNERRWRQMLRERVGIMLRNAEGESTAEEDAALLETLGAPGRERSEMRRHAAILTRLGEKRNLKAVLEVLAGLAK